jgi:hypothetical protein
MKGRGKMLAMIIRRQGQWVEGVGAKKQKGLGFMNLSQENPRAV